MDEKQTARRSRTRQLVIAVTAVLAALVFALLLLRSGVRSSGDASPETEPYTFDGSARQVFCAVDGRLAVASSSGLQLFDKDGAPLHREVFSLVHPGLSAGRECAAAFDVGGRQLRVVPLEGEPLALETKDTILSASVNADGWVTVVTETAGYRGLVTVYDAALQPVYEWYSGTDYPLHAVLSDKNDRLAVLCVGETGSAVHLFSLGSETPLGSCTVPEELFADLFWMTDGCLCAVSQSRLLFLSDSAQETGSYAYDGRYLCDYSKDGDGFCTLLLSQYRSGSAEKAVTVAPHGAVLGERPLDGDVKSVSVCGRQVLLFESGCLTLCSQRLETVKTAEQDTTGVRQAVLLRRGQALLLFANSAQVCAL